MLVAEKDRGRDKKVNPPFDSAKFGRRLDTVAGVVFSRALFQRLASVGPMRAADEGHLGPLTAHRDFSTGATPSKIVHSMSHPTAFSAAVGFGDIRNLWAPNSAKRHGAVAPSSP